ncbi:MAG TPA: RNA polymerase sigma factor [Polyangia bacterium]
MVADAQLVALRSTLFAAALVQCGSPGDADDFVQTALTKALEWRGKLRPDTNLKAWLTRVIRNLVIDAARHAKKHGGTADPAMMPAPLPEKEPAWGSLSREQIEWALRRSSPVLREAFELHYFGGLSLVEIARRQQTNVRTIGVRLFRVRAALRANLTEMLSAQAPAHPRGQTDREIEV